MTEHVLKTWPEPFAALLEGCKTAEFRRDDRGFAAGDLLVLREWQPRREAEGGTPYPLGFAPDLGPGTAAWAKQPPGEFTGREVRAPVSHISRGPDWGIPAGFVVMSLGPGDIDLGELAPALGKVVKPRPLVVHQLWHGRSLCNTTPGVSDRVPRDWPEGHSWVAAPAEMGAEDATECAECRYVSLPFFARAGKLP